MHRVITIIEHFWNFLTTAFLALLLFISPVTHFIHLASALIFIDFVMGILSSWKLGNRITARKMGKTVYKLILYSVAIISTYIVQLIAADDGVGLVRICAATIGVTELKSIYDHISKILGGDLFTQIWNIIKSRLDNSFSTAKTNHNDESNG